MFTYVEYYKERPLLHLSHRLLHLAMFTSSLTLPSLRHGTCWQNSLGRSLWFCLLNVIWTGWCISKQWTERSDGMSLWILGHEGHCGLDYPLWLRHHDQELQPSAASTWARQSENRSWNDRSSSKAVYDNTNVFLNVPLSAHLSTSTHTNTHADACTRLCSQGWIWSFVLSKCRLHYWAVFLNLMSGNVLNSEIICYTVIDN